MIARQEISEKFSFLGISKKGEAHLKTGKPNQDAILFNALDDSFVVAVSDGLGSCKRSQIGAQKAVSLCNEVFLELIDERLIFNAEIIVKRLSDLWNESFPQAAAKEYSATIKAVFLKNNELIAISVGDGLLFIRTDEGVFTLNNKDTDFINETSCLSHGMQLNIFSTKAAENITKAFVFICTDGVSVTISEGREREMFEEIAGVENVQKLQAEIENMLVEMSEYNSDDKTIGLVKYER